MKRQIDLDLTGLFPSLSNQGLERRLQQPLLVQREPSWRSGGLLLPCTASPRRRRRLGSRATSALPAGHKDSTRHFYHKSIKRPAERLCYRPDACQHHAASCIIKLINQGVRMSCTFPLLTYSDSCVECSIINMFLFTPAPGEKAKNMSIFHLHHLSVNELLGRLV